MGPRPYRVGPNQAVPPGPCYDCGGEHWIRDCPNPKQERKGEFGLPPLNKSCAECGIKHLVQDFPVLYRQERKGDPQLC